MRDLESFTEFVFREDVDVQKRLDYLFQTIDDLLLQGKFEAVDTALFAVKEEYMEKCVEHPSIGVGFLVVTNGCTELESRDEFASSLHDRFEEEGLDADLLTKGLI